MIHITAHAVLRYRQRVADVSDDQARQCMDTAAVRSAVLFGAPYVRLASGQRLVVQDGAVVTVLPSDMKAGKLDPRRRTTS